MFSTKLSGAPIGAPWDTADWETDPDWEFNSAANDTLEQLYGSGTAPSNGPARGSTQPWLTADSTSVSTSPCPTGAISACAGCSAT